MGFSAVVASPDGQHADEGAAAVMLGATVLSYVAGAALPQQVYQTKLPRPHLHAVICSS